MKKSAPAPLMNPARRGIPTAHIQRRNKPGTETSRAGRARSATPREALNKSILDFSRPLVLDLPAAGRRRPESSGLNNPFPQSENDNYRQDKPNAASAKTRRPFTIWASPSWIPAFAGMTARREKAGRHPANPFAITDKYLPSSPCRHLWTGSPVCGERAGCP